MTEIIQSHKSFRSGWALRCATVASLVLLSGAVSAVRPQEQASAYSLVVGQPVAREMRGGEEHQYQVNLSAGQYARIALEQKGIDVVVVLLGADGKPLVEVDNNLSGTRGMEVVSLLAEVNGAYVLNVRSQQAMARIGAVREGTLRRHMITASGRRRDSVYFSVIDEEWPTVRQNFVEKLLKQ